jgi:hypothetical protein
MRSASLGIDKSQDNKEEAFLGRKRRFKGACIKEAALCWQQHLIKGGRKSHR